MPQTVIKWKLAEVMARYKISGTTLAKSLGVGTNAISNLKNATTMPRINGDRLNELCSQIEELSGQSFALSELMEYCTDTE